MENKTLQISDNLKKNFNPSVLLATKKGNLVAH